MDPLAELIIPQELAILIGRNENYAPVHSPRNNIVREQQKVVSGSKSRDLPNNIDLFPFSRYVKEHFRDPALWGVLTNPIRTSLSKEVADRDIKQALILHKLVLRYMRDKNLRGATLKLFADYIVNLVSNNPQLTDELFVQIASLTWNNFDEDYQARLWRLLAHCSSCHIPSPELHSFLLKYVSDHAMGDFPGHLQHNLLQMPQRNFYLEKRMFPPCVLEWEANNTCCNIVVQIYFPDDSFVLVRIDSWTTVEDAARQAVQAKGFSNNQGWNLAFEEYNNRVTEMSGHDYVLDVFSQMEILPELDTPPHEFLIYTKNDISQQDAVPFNPGEFLGVNDNGDDSLPPADYSREEPFQEFRGSSQYSSNFSFGPPNTGIQEPNGQGSHSGSMNIHSVDKRIKGGGKMMHSMGMGNPMMGNNMMGMNMMQQPQMMPQMGMQGMQPMMQPMMQQPSMMQGMVQPNMMMPSSVGMMSSGMNAMGPQQMMMQQQMQMLLKQQMEQQDSLTKLIKATKSKKKERVSSDDDDDDDDDENFVRQRNKFRQRESSPRVYRNSSKSSTKSKVHRRYAMDSSDEEEKTIKKEAVKSQRSFQHKEKRSTSPREKSKQKRSESVKKKSPVRKLSSSESDHVSAAVLSDLTGMKEDGQGTVKMSFHAKRKFFLAKALAENQPQKPKPIQKPRKMSILKPEDLEDELSDRDRTKSDSSSSSGLTISAEVKNSEMKRKEVTRTNSQAQKDIHAEAMKLLAAKKVGKTIKEEKKEPVPEVKKVDSPQSTHAEALALLNRQRREAARIYPVRKSPSPPPPPPPPPPPVQDVMVVTRKEVTELDKNYTPAKRYSKLQPQRMTPINDKPVAPPARKSPPSTRPDNIGTKVIVAATLEERRRQQLEEQVSQEIPAEPQKLLSDDNMKTVFHFTHQRANVRYGNVNWKLRIRKEIFHSREVIDEVKVTELIFQQIVKDSNDEHPRISAIEREQIHEYTGNQSKVAPSVQKSIVESCRDNWRVYFTQLFRVKIREVAQALPKDIYQCNNVGVGHTGLHFLTISESQGWAVYSYKFHDISNIQEPKQAALELDVQGRKVGLFCRKSNILKKLILPFLMTPPANIPTAPPAQLLEKGENESESGTEAPISYKSEEIYEVLPPPKSKNNEEYSLLAFALQRFRKPKEAEKALQHSKNSVNKPLLGINNSEQVKALVICFQGIQRFMGDISSKSVSDEACIYKILTLCYKFKEKMFIDEVFIYLAKQTTNNRKEISCKRGWRLFALFAAFYHCSELLLPHLLAHLHKIADSDDQFSNGAAVVLVNLQHSLEYQGRKQLPSDIEAKALTIGRTTFQQIFLLPGSIQWSYKVNTSSVIEEVIINFCNTLGLQTAEHVNEYAVFNIIMDKDANVVNIIPMQRTDYLLDVNTEMRRAGMNFVLMFQRIVWQRSITYDNEILVKILFHQCVPEYLDGKILSRQELTGEMTRTQLTEIAKLSALMHRGFEKSSLPSQEEVLTLIPRQVRIHQNQSKWRDMTHNQFTSIQTLTAHQARSEVLAMLSNRKMCGGSFFKVEHENSFGQGETKILCVYKSGLAFINAETMLVETEYDLAIIQKVNYYLDATKSPICEITLAFTDEEERTLKLKTKKALVIARVVNQHVILRKQRN